MTENRVKFDFEARYYVRGSLKRDTKKLIFVLHGHGQLAQFFIKKFDPLVSKECCVIAPEGLNRYYLQGFSGRVGSTWMTKEDRLTDINNYLTFLDTMYAEIRSRIDEEKCSITLLGFSQGAATASRWTASATFNIKRLILWAGILPPDMNFDEVGKKFKDLQTTYVYGTKDPYINKDRLDEMKALSSKLDIDPEVVTFDGEHDIDANTLMRLNL